MQIYDKVVWVRNCFNEVVGRIVSLENYKEYHSDRKPEHFMIKYQGFGVSQDILDHLKMLNITKIKIFYYGKTGKIMYVSELEQWFNSTKTHTDREIDLQKFLSTSEMQAYPMYDDQR